jgi:hypothetical protein
MLKCPIFQSLIAIKLGTTIWHAFTLGNWPLCSMPPPTIDQLWMVGALEF